MAHFAVSGNHFSEEDIFLNFQKADFDSVWGDLSPDSLSDDEQVLFEQPETVVHTEIGLWKELEPLQTVLTPLKNMETISKMDDSGNESVDKFDQIFNQAIINKTTENIMNDPMLSSSFELATPQHPFEEDLLLPEDPNEDATDIYSPRSTVYYSSSAEDEEVEDNLSTSNSTKASKVNNSPPPHGYPNSIHSYSQLSTKTGINDDVSNDMEEEEPTSINIIQTDSTLKAKDKSLSIKKVSFKPRNRRRQRKSRVYEVTISEPVKKSPKKKTFANGKAKLYAVKPLADPSAEKARLNAINAKKNRDFKKREKEIIAQEVASLRHENGTLKKTAAAMRKRAAEAESELRRLQAAIRSNQLEDVIKAAGKKHKESDKLSFLDITSSSDTDLQSLWS
jgi:hypothetical protein